MTTGKFSGHAATPMAVLACCPTSSPKTLRTTSENPLRTAVVWAYPLGLDESGHRHPCRHAIEVADRG